MYVRMIQYNRCSVKMGFLTTVTITITTNLIIKGKELLVIKGNNVPTIAHSMLYSYNKLS